MDLNNEFTSDWLKQMMAMQNQNQNQNPERPLQKQKFVCYPPDMVKCGCECPEIMTSNDGNRHQQCTKCGTQWNAP